MLGLFSNFANLFGFLGVGLCLLLSVAPPAFAQVSPETRIFPALKLEYLDRQVIGKSLTDNSFQNTVVGGLSAITYDRQEDCYYALSDDRSNRAPARFYTLKLATEQTGQDIAIANLEITNVTFLQDTNGQPYEAGTIDGEGIALSPRRTLFISSEGNPSKNIAPFIGEFDLATGKKILDIPLPKRYLAEASSETGIRENLAFESLTVNQTGLLKDDPFRLFTATESSLRQDVTEDPSARLRFLHYVINPFGSPILVAEHLYPLEPAGIETISNGLTEIYALKREGYFLSLERTFGFTGAGAKIFQVVVGDATDTSTYKNLQETSQIRPLKKKLLLDLADLGIYLDNLEGMTLGGMLPDGSRSLILISDNNFNEEQVSQILLFRLRE